MRYEIGQIMRGKDDIHQVFILITNVLQDAYLYKYLDNIDGREYRMMKTIAHQYYEYESMNEECPTI